MIKCENCIYFKSMMPDSSQGVGNCIRRTPKASDVLNGGYWPFVYYNQACGEFVSKIDSGGYISNYEYDYECSE